MVENKKLVLMPIIVHLLIVAVVLLGTVRLSAQHAFTEINYRKADSSAHALKGHLLHDLPSLSAVRSLPGWPLTSRTIAHSSL